MPGRHSICWTISLITFTDNDVDASGGLNADEADDDVGAIRLPGADGTEPTEDDDLHRFAAMDADGNGELSEAELNDQLLNSLMKMAMVVRLPSIMNQ